MNCSRGLALNWSQLIQRPPLQAQQQIESCERHPDDADIPFDWLLAEVTRKHGPYEFVLSEPVRCPNCRHEITGKTLVEPVDLQGAPLEAVSLTNVNLRGADLREANLRGSNLRSADLRGADCSVSQRPAHDSDGFRARIRSLMCYQCREL